MLRRLLPIVLLTFFACAPIARAQDVRVAVCNPAKVFEKLDERKAIQDRMAAERDRINAEVKRRKLEVDDIRTQREQLKPDSTQYAEKTQLMMQKAVEFEVWAKIQQEEMASKEKNQVKQLYDKIAAACKVVAEQKKIDLVLSERAPELPPDLTKITPDQLRMILAQTDVLYKNDKADITGAVILQLNEEYAKGGK